MLRISNLANTIFTKTYESVALFGRLEGGRSEKVGANNKPIDDARLAKFEKALEEKDFFGARFVVEELLGFRDSKEMNPSSKGRWQSDKQSMPQQIPTPSIDPQNIVHPSIYNANALPLAEKLMDSALEAHKTKDPDVRQSLDNAYWLARDLKEVAQAVRDPKATECAGKLAHKLIDVTWPEIQAIDDKKRAGYSKAAKDVTSIDTYQSVEHHPYERFSALAGGVEPTGEYSSLDDAPAHSGTGIRNTVKKGEAQIEAHARSAMYEIKQGFKASRQKLGLD